MDCRHRLVFREPAGARIHFGPGTDLRLAFGEHLDIQTSDLPDYDGPYIAVPSWAQQDFPTAERAMRDDFTVQPMLELETPNEAGGLTLTI